MTLSARNSPPSISLCSQCFQWVDPDGGARGNIAGYQSRALVREREIQRGNKNRAALDVARKMVAYMLAVERGQQDFVPAQEMAGKAVA
jgi:hypothetical protein